MYIKHWFDKFKNLYTFIQIILSESFFNRIFLIGLRAQYNKPITLRSKKKNEDFFHQTYAFGRNDTHIILNGTLAKWRISHQESTNRVKNLLDRSVEGEMLRCCSACFRDLSHTFEMTTMSFWRPQGGRISYPNTCHSERHCLEESPTKKVRAKWKIS